MMSGTDKTPGLIHLQETESTNRYLRQLSDAETLPGESVVVADFQTAGQGQPGNSWESEAGKNLTCSLLVYPPSRSAGQPFVIAEMAALSVKRTLDMYATDITVKWPNDLYRHNRKIGGILIENEWSGSRMVRSIIGIGINLNQQTFRSDAPNPVSLTQITGLTHDPMEILDRLRQAFHRLNRQLETEGPEVIHREYAAALYRREGFHPYRDAGGCFEACIHRIEPSGHLILKRRDGTLARYAFKEVCHLTEPSYICTQNIHGI
jgi:BirA family biotin operon repressor/biotin-[acetyl-CoA-carboxylase] ligase